jgi:hypothetical protein
MSQIIYNTPRPAVPQVVVASPLVCDTINKYCKYTSIYLNRKLLKKRRKQKLTKFEFAHEKRPNRYKICDTFLRTSPWEICPDPVLRLCKTCKSDGLAMPLLMVAMVLTALDASLVLCVLHVCYFRIISRHSTEDRMVL